MLGSFQRAHSILQAEVDKLRKSQAELEERLRDEDRVKAELSEMRAKCEAISGENAELQQTLAKRRESEQRDSKEIKALRNKAAKLEQELRPLREENLKLVQHRNEEQRRAQLSEEELAQLQGAEAALEEALGVLWMMLEDLAMQFFFAPPWKCALCSCSNPHLERTCGVCDSPKGGSTDCGGKACEAYFEFRLHQEFLEKRPLPLPESRLAALRIALGHRQERWIQTEEIEALYDMLKDLAGDEAMDSGLRAESAFVLFSLGDGMAKRLGKMMLRDMGQRTDAVKLMCRRLQEQRVAVLFHRLLVLKKHDVAKFRAWEERFQKAQARFQEMGPAAAVERSRSSRLSLSRSVSSDAGSQPETLLPGAISEGQLGAAAVAAAEKRGWALARRKTAPPGVVSRVAEEEEEDDDEDESECKNIFPLSAEGTYSAAGLATNNHLWSARQLSGLFFHDKWNVGETWTFSVEATSQDSVAREFSFSGGSGFLRIEVPAGADALRITVTDTVKSLSSKFMYRGKNGTVGDVTFTDIYIAPGSAVPARYAV